MNFYYNSICHVCKQVNINIKRCSSCKSIAYCSKIHQVSDWKNHKQICKELSKFTKCTRLEEGCSYEDWRAYRIQLKFHIEHRLKRLLLPYESQMWMFPRHCAVCYSTKNLKDCQACFCVVYCSNEHEQADRTTHEKYCNQLRLCLDYDIFYSDKPDLELRWKEVGQGIKSLPVNISECLDLFLDMAHINSVVEKIFITDIFATIFTIIYVLEKCGILENRCISEGTLIIHMVGADISEFSLNWSFQKYLLQGWIKNLIACKFILVGPDCPASSNNRNELDKVHIDYIRGYYHNVVEEIDKPDIIMALNSGLHEFESTKYDTWDKSLPELINKNVPLILTAYTRDELEKDLKRLPSPLNEGDIQRNPFSNLRPIRDWDSKENAVFFVNAYLAIVNTGNIK